MMLADAAFLQSIAFKILDMGQSAEAAVAKSTYEAHNVLLAMLDTLDTVVKRICRICRCRSRDQLPFRIAAMVEVPAAALTIEQWNSFLNLECKHDRKLSSRWRRKRFHDAFE